MNPEYDITVNLAQLKNGVTITGIASTETSLVSTVMMSGPQGPQGDMGPQGPQGIAGPKGDQGAQGAQGIQGVQGLKGDTGATGAKGDTGATGPQGATGATGTTGSKGDKGDTGSAGQAATITVGSVTTGAPGSTATVTNAGTSNAAVFNFSIPRGDTGASGSGSGNVTGPTSATDNAISRYDGTSGQIIQNSSVFIDDSGNLGLGVQSPTSNIDILSSYPSFKVRNNSSAQYSGAGFFLLNTASTMANQAGANFYMGINDASATQGYFAIDKTNVSGGGTGHLMLFDYSSNTASFYQPLNMMSNKITSVSDPTNPQDAATKAYVDSGKYNRVIQNVSTTLTGGAVSNTDYVYILNAGASYTQPSATSNNNRYTLKNNTTGTLTINASASQTIEGSASISIAAGDSTDLISNGSTAWSVI